MNRPKGTNANVFRKSSLMSIFPFMMTDSVNGIRFMFLMCGKFSMGNCSLKMITHVKAIK